MRKLHKLILVLCAVLISILVVSCKKEKVEYPPLLTEEEVLERLEKTYGKEFEIRSKTDLLSLGKLVKAPGPYSDIAGGFVYEASPKSDSSFVFKVYTYRAYGNASPIPFSKSGGLQIEPEYYECYGPDLLEQRFREKAKKYGITYETEYEGFRDGNSTSEEANDARRRGKVWIPDFEEKDYHIAMSYNIYIKEVEIEEMAEKLSLCITELMKEYCYEVGMNLYSSIDIQVCFKDRDGKEETTSYVGRNLFCKRWGLESGEFDISKEFLIRDLKQAVEEEKN
ncbi:hypothetical protein [Clostridium sp. Marseille-P2415]|uniref:hypothetical protein n=1 Tax=Clostridium sp. Marseille-P2415 TaxID=1805471 RepID=UPI00098854AB|nr:hypothetical protein [Clostridium sp. Marseille-P2415]